LPKPKKILRQTQNIQRVELEMAERFSILFCRASPYYLLAGVTIANSEKAIAF
jgi:hypothetical protein